MLVTNTSDIVNNWGTTYVAVLPTQTVYLSEEDAFIELEKTLYKADIPFGHEVKWWMNLDLTPVQGAPVELIYWKMEQKDIFAFMLFGSGSVSTTCVDAQALPETKTTLAEILDIEQYPAMNRILKHPTIIDVQHDFYWHLLYPLQLPALLFDIAATTAAVVIAAPPYLVMRLFGID